MSFRTLKVQDPRIGDITSKLDYAVYSGAANNTYQSFPSNSASTSSVSFNITPPSESTVVARQALIETTTKFQIRIGSVPVGDIAFSYGVNDSLQAFPFNSLISTASASINNSNISNNLMDTKDLLLKCFDPKDLAKYSDGCPSLVDSFYKTYSDGGVQSELNGYAQSGYDKYLQPRACHPLSSYVVEHYVGGVYADASVTSTDLTDYWIIKISVQTTEPLILSPFIYGAAAPGSEMGFYGINQMNIVLNIDAAMRRFWSSKSSGYTYQFTLDSSKPFESSLLLNFLTVQPDQCVDVRSVIPYLETPRYITPPTNTPAIAPGATATISTQNIQLSKIPDLFLIAVRKPVSSQSCFDSASFLPIQSVSINFNNSSGLLSSASQKDLYKISKANGVHQSWIEFSGYASTFDFSAIDGKPLEIPTVGSVLAINPAIDLSLAPYIANGVSGQYNLQMTITVKNNDVAAYSPEVVVIPVSSGIMTTQAGNTQYSSGLLTKELVMDSEHSDVVSRSQMKRMIGGSFLGTIGSIVKASLPAVAKVLSGQAQSGGARSAGKLSKYRS